jgi:uncharacterized protein YraI/quercetin dioxygenase-like cupin family protein
MKFWRKFVCLFVLVCFTSIAAQAATAQDEVCSATVQAALAEVDQGCSETGRNQACYGYVALEATAREGAQDFSFTQQGDLANVGDIDTLRLSALDLDNDQWGIALLKLQANLPDTLPGENVTFLLFGDVELTNAVAPVDTNAEVAEPVTLTATSTGGANVRSEPSTEGAIAGGLATGESVTVNGRNGDSSWLRIEIPDSDDQGWVSASLLSVDGDVSTLDVVEGTDALEAFTPMQAFYFRTGITDTTCAEAPPDGILIQTPEGAGKINLRANDVDVELGSTGFFQAVPDAEMTISVVEGEGSVTSNGVTVTVPAGTQVTVPIDENMQAVGEPSEAQPYDEALVENLPVEVLPEAIEIAPPAMPEPEDESGQAPFPGGDMFGGMNPAMFCMMMDQQFAQEGMSREEVMAEMQTAMAELAAMGYAMPADSQAGLDQFMAMMEQCE